MPGLLDSGIGAAEDDAARGGTGHPWEARNRVDPTLPCPNGDSHLVALMVRGCEIDICPRCHSVWLDRNKALSIAHCFKESSAIVAAEQGSQGIAPAWTGVTIADTVLNALALIFR